MNRNKCLPVLAKIQIENLKTMKSILQILNKKIKMNFWVTLKFDQTNKVKFKSPNSMNRRKSCSLILQLNKNSLKKRKQEKEILWLNTQNVTDRKNSYDSLLNLSLQSSDTCKFSDWGKSKKSKRKVQTLQRYWFSLISIDEQKNKGMVKLKNNKVKFL